MKVTRTKRIVPFPLYHGSSTHYLSGFLLGRVPANWPLKQDGIDLLRTIWSRLRSCGVEPEPWLQNILDQKAGAANWQHGFFYVTASERTAVNYAGGGAEYGGELLTQCREGLNRLSQIDEPAARYVIDRMGPGLRPLLAGGGKPILVELVDIERKCLESETNLDRDQEIDRLVCLSVRERHVSGQQINFRLLPRSGTVAKVHLLDIANAKDSLSAYSKVPITDG